MLGKAERWGVFVGGGLKLHYARLASGPGVNVGREVLGIDGTLVLVTLGLALEHARARISRLHRGGRDGAKTPLGRGNRYSMPTDSLVGP